MTRAVSLTVRGSGSTRDVETTRRSLRYPRSHQRVFAQLSQLPLTSLLFLLPLVIVFYEVGTYRFAAQRVVAFDLLHDFYPDSRGARSIYLPAMALVSMLDGSWHIARKDPLGTAL